MPGRLTSADRSEIMADYAMTRNIRATAKRCGRAYNTVKRIVKDPENAELIVRAKAQVSGVTSDKLQSIGDEAKLIAKLANASFSIGDKILEIGNRLAEEPAKIRARALLLLADGKKAKAEKLYDKADALELDLFKKIGVFGAREMLHFALDLIHSKLPTSDEWAKIYNGIVRLIDNCPNDEAKAYFANGFTHLMSTLQVDREALVSEAVNGVLE